MAEYTSQSGAPWVTTGGEFVVKENDTATAHYVKLQATADGGRIVVGQLGSLNTDKYFDITTEGTGSANVRKITSAQTAWGRYQGVLATTGLAFAGNAVLIITGAGGGAVVYGDVLPVTPGNAALTTGIATGRFTVPELPVGSGTPEHSAYRLTGKIDITTEAVTFAAGDTLDLEILEDGVTVVAAARTEGLAATVGLNYQINLNCMHIAANPASGTFWELRLNSSAAADFRIHGAQFFIEAI
jgi:hypothetical protein